MKTTVEISDPLLKEVRSLAAREHTTVSASVAEGLRRITGERRRAHPFKLHKVSFRGNGLQHDMSSASWQQVRDAAYQGQGA